MVGRARSPFFFVPCWVFLASLASTACGPSGQERKRLEEQLLTEASVCNTPTVKDLLKKGARIESIGEGRATTPLLEAASRGCTETVEFLLKEGAQLEVVDQHGSTALVIAAKRGKADTVKSLLAGGAKPDAKDEEGWTALMFASYNGQLEMIRDLIGAGAYVNMRNYQGCTALDLTGYKPPVPPGTAPTDSPLRFPLPGWQPQPEAAEILLKSGASVAC